jgi:UDP-N-acetylmuramyl pentapeptide phosphotransferase/UDP-N-acetylglucosamine-1-phosphate transferase
MTTPQILSAAFATFFSFSFSLIFIQWARQKFAGSGFQDQATTRSLHSGSTPKVGGLALFPAVCFGLVLYYLVELLAKGSPSLELSWLPNLFAWVGSCLIIFFVCLISDRTTTELPALIRFFAFLVASAVFSGLLLYQHRTGVSQLVSIQFPFLSMWQAHWGLGIVGAAMMLSLLAFTNFFNFMDGMDGLAGSMGFLGFAALAAGALGAEKASTLGIPALLASAACFGFLFWNWPKAKVFMGDTGSTFLGFSACAFGWIGSANELWHWSFPFFVFFPFWFDATLTLLRRLLRGEKVWQAHREHFYQRAVLGLDFLEMSERHRRVLWPSIGLMLLSAWVALEQHFHWAFSGTVSRWAWFATLVLVHSGVAVWVEVHYQGYLSRASTRDDLGGKTSAHHSGTR